MTTDTRLRAAALLALFLAFLVAGIVGGGSFWPDVAAIRALQDIRDDAPRLTLAAVGLTQLGSVYVTLGAGLATALLLAIRGHRRHGLVVAGLVLGERLTLDGLKLLLDRARPAFDAHPVATHSSSFPSGHSGNSMAVFLAIALIAVPERWRTQAVTSALVLSILIGLTRPYLGVHWPSDVVGGWSLGALLALLAYGYIARNAAPAVSGGGTAA